MIRAHALVPTAVVAKDLRLRMRGWRWAGVMTLYVSLLALVAVAFLIQKYGPTSAETSRAGIELFQALSIFQLLLITFVTPASAAGAISGERQQRTWDLLVASRLSALQIVWGKLLVGLASNLLLVAASLPLFSLVFLFGGVGAGDLLHVLIVMVVTVLLLCTVSIAVSTVCGRLTVSFMLSLLVALALTIGISILAVILQSPGEFSPVTLAGIPFGADTTPSPLTPFVQIDPLVALLSALPSNSGDSLLGSVGTIDHAFGLSWRLPFWGAYSILGCVLSAAMIVIGAGLLGGARVRKWPRHAADGGHG